MKDLGEKQENTSRVKPVYKKVHIDIPEEKDNEMYREAFLAGIDAACEKIWNELQTMIPDSEWLKHLTYNDFIKEASEVRDCFYAYCHTSNSYKNMQNCLTCPYRDYEDSVKKGLIEWELDEEHPLCKDLINMIKNRIVHIYYYQLHIYDEEGVLCYYTNLDAFLMDVESIDAMYIPTQSKYPHAGEYRLIAETIRKYPEVFSDVLEYLMIINADWSDKEQDGDNMCLLDMRFRKIIPIITCIDKRYSAYWRMFDKTCGLENMGWKYTKDYNT